MNKLIVILLFALAFTCIVLSLPLEDMNEAVETDTHVVKRCSSLGLCIYKRLSRHYQ